MNNITNIDPKYVDKNGIYINMDIPTIFRLSDSEILALRQYYKNEKIAIDRKINLKSENLIMVAKKPKKRRYKMTRQRISKEEVKVAEMPENSKKSSIIIGGMVISVFLMGNMAAINTLREQTDVKQQNPYDYITIEPYSSQIADVDDEKTESKSLISEEVEKFVERRQEIKHYCDIYQVDFEVVYPKLVVLTDDFTNENYLNGQITGVTSNGEKVHATSENELLLYAVRCMKQFPEQLGISEDLLNENGLYQKNEYVSPDEYMAQLDFVSNIIGVDRRLLYAIVQTGCGFDSKLFNEFNNPAGLKNSETRNYLTFDTKEEGFIELGIEIKNFYHLNKIDSDKLDNEVIRKLNDKFDKDNDAWGKSVMQSLEYAQLHEAELFGDVKTNHSTIAF